MCRTGGRRCPSHSDPKKVAARNQRRRMQYAKTKTVQAQASTGTIDNSNATVQFGFDDDATYPFLYGDCHMMAEYLRDNYDLPVVTVMGSFSGDEDLEGQEWAHILNVLPNGLFVDALGTHTEEEVLNNWQGEQLVSGDEHIKMAFSQHEEKPDNLGDQMMSKLGIKHVSADSEEVQALAPEMSKQQTTPEQAEYFKESKAVKDGQLITLYHGSAHEFSSFDPQTLGRGNDSWGNGFYFTDQESTAKGYAAGSDSPTANVKEFYLNLTNPMYVDGKEKMSLNDVEFKADAVSRMLKNHPTAYLQPGEEDENGNASFLGDYSPDYWDKETHSKADLNRMIDKIAKDNSDYGMSWPELEGLYGRDYGSAFLEAMQKETGHDGVIVDFGDAGKHFIAWFPDQMKLTSNVKPEHDTFF
jgi:hypothetical protein